MNVLPAWKKGITGKNVVITILDDGKCLFSSDTSIYRMKTIWPLAQTEYSLILPPTVVFRWCACASITELLSCFIPHQFVKVQISLRSILRTGWTKFLIKALNFMAAQVRIKSGLKLAPSGLVAFNALSQARILMPISIIQVVTYIAEASH